MRALTFSLLLAVVTSVIGLGWAIDQWYNMEYVPQEHDTIKTYRQLCDELVNLIDTTGADEKTLDLWASKSKTELQIVPYADFPLPENLQKSFEQGEPLLLESGSAISLHYFLARQQAVVSFNLSHTVNKADQSRLSWLLTFIFYIGVIFVVLIWLYPLHNRLSILRRVTQSFGGGNLNARIPAGKVSYIADIEKEFNRMAQQIESLIYDNKLLSRGLSHDLRTPIARLRFGLDVLAEAELSPSQSKTISHLNRDLIAMESLVETLLSYSRLDQGKVSFTAVAVDIRELLGAIVREFYAEKVAVNFEKAGFPAIILADTEYLNMILHNLLQNAERYGNGIINASVTSDKKEVVLTIEDNGAGIPVAEREHVLKPFYRIATAQDTKGHGMGLAIVERIAQWHGARLLLENSESLGGLKISVIFPAVNG